MTNELTTASELLDARVVEMPCTAELAKTEPTVSPQNLPCSEMKDAEFRSNRRKLRKEIHLCKQPRQQILREPPNSRGIGRHESGSGPIRALLPLKSI